MVASKANYEELRQKRLEENKKRMEDLNLTKLMFSLKETSPRPSPVKQSKPRSISNEIKGLIEVRRSPRVANKPAPDYKEATFGVEWQIVRRGGYKRRDLSGRKYASDEARLDAIERAEETQSKLEPELPNFIKPMLQSHVSGGFWLGLPKHFCSSYLPKRDSTVTLIDEDGNQTPTVYLVQKTGLSGGWRGFSLDHILADGDALIFQLVKPTTFKVYIIRAGVVNGP